MVALGEGDGEGGNVMGMQTADGGLGGACASADSRFGGGLAVRGWHWVCCSQRVVL